MKKLFFAIAVFGMLTIAQSMTAKEKTVPVIEQVSVNTLAGNIP